jgi:ribose transport system ATP-binding protein
VSTMRSTGGEAPLVEVSGLTKSYGAVKALRAANFEVRAGEVMALLGENGSGKSTMVKILGGLVQRDEGVIRIRGEEVALHNARESREAGVAIVTQEFSLIPGLSAAENVFLGSDLSGLWNQRRLQREAKPFLDSVGLSAKRRRQPVETLSVGERQLIEVARVLAREARILIFDEPTAALSDVEIARILDLVRQLVSEGRAVIFVTHRLGEVFEIATRATIMRDGQSLEPITVADTDIDGLIARMLGRTLQEVYPDHSRDIGASLMKVDGLATSGLNEPVSLDLKRGEIIGLAGQLGSGASLFLESLAGVKPMVEGSVHLEGEELNYRTVRQAMASGIAYCSPDRKENGIFHDRSVRDNLTAPALPRVTPLGWFSGRRARQLSRSLAQRFQIAANRMGASAGHLSGGNQQKVALGKWLGIEPRILLVDEPTRGVDIGARAEIYRHLRQLADEGIGIVFASSDLAEVEGLADTVVTFYRGKMVRSVPAAELTPDEMMHDVTHGPAVVAS